MDMTDSVAPKGDQLDAVDLLSGPRTFTIAKVTEGNPDQPFHFHLEGFPRTWRPGKNMRRVIIGAWGRHPSKYAGHRVTLFCDQSVMFGSDNTGGTRISHISGIDEPLSVPVMFKRGKPSIYTVQPLAEIKSRDWLAELELAGDDIDAVAALGKAAQAAHATAGELAQIRARWNELKGTK